MERLTKCEKCTEPCPQAELTREIAKGRMYAMQTIVEMQKELQAYKDAEERGELVRVVRCKDCVHWRGGGINESDDFIPPMCLWHNMPTHASEYCLYGVRDSEVALAKDTNVPNKEG